MFQILAGLLAFFYDHVVHDYATAITLLTVAVMAILAPLTWKGTRSMLAMQRLQPEIKKLQAKHKNDRQALNEAMMAFYKEHQINPLSGCLPTLIQFPVLIVMFRVLRGLTHTSHGHAAPQYIAKTSHLYHALVNAGGHMVSLGMDLSKNASEATGTDKIPLFILSVLVIGSSYWQSRQMMARNTSAAAANPQAQMMQRIFPLISGLISFRLPGGVVLYFLVSNLVRIAQQSLMYRLDPSLAATVQKEVKEIDAKADLIERKHKSGDTSGAPKPVTSGRVTPSSGGNGASANGRPPSSRRNRKRRSRRR
jgi:YidC/Oxa1 family membrane protein insertase